MIALMMTKIIKIQHILLRALFCVLFDY